MKKKRFRVERMVGILKQAEVGVPVPYQNRIKTLCTAAIGVAD